jgi:hypothetical protein
MSEKRSIGEVIREGQTLTLELMDLKRKKVAGTATAEDKERIIELDSYLLGVAGEAQALGFGTQVDLTGLVGEETELGLDEDESPFAFEEYDEDGYDADGYNADGMTREEVEEEQELSVEETQPEQENRNDSGGLFGTRNWFR